MLQNTSNTVDLTFRFVVRRTIVWERRNPTRHGQMQSRQPRRPTLDAHSRDSPILWGHLAGVAARTLVLAWISMV